MSTHSLSFKIIVSVGIVLIIAFAIFAYAYLQIEEKQMLAKSKHMAEFLASVIHKGLTEAMLEGKTDKVQKMVENYGRLQEIDKIRIFDPDTGIILVDANRTDIGRIIEQRYRSLLRADTQTQSSSLGTEKQSLSVVIPILNEPQCHTCHGTEREMLGALDIGVSVVETFKDIASNRLRMIGFALLTVVGTSLVIAIFIICFVNRPIKELVTTMARVESGDLTAQARVINHSELGDLTRNFNSMTTRLRREIERLEVLHEIAEDFRTTIDPSEIEHIVIRGVVRGLKFERAALLLVNEQDQTLEGRLGIGIAEDVVQRVKIPLERDYGILAETVLDAKPFNVGNGIYDLSLMPEQTVKCWDFHKCDQIDCPAHGAEELRCWLQSQTHCYDNLQTQFQDKAEVCCECPVLQEAYGKKAMLVLLMFGSKAFATVPLMAQDKPIGIVMVDNLHSGRRITDEDIKAMSVFAAQAGMAIENAKLYKRLESRIEAADEELRQKVIALTEMTNFNDSILQNMRNGLVTLDTDRKIVYFNAAAEAILGYRAAEVQGKPIQEIFPSLEAPIFETLREDTDSTFREITVCTKTDNNVPIEVSTSLLKDDAGQTTGVVIIFTDLTERQEMERQIRRADRLATLGNLAAGIAHEIRNPLAGISGAVQILRDDLSEMDPSREIFDEIVEQIDTLATSIRDFLRFARPAPLQLSPVDINEVVQSVIFLVRTQAEMQEISIVETYEEDLPTIMADAEQIQQVILNIALNALQAIRETQGEVRFKTFRVGALNPGSDPGEAKTKGQIVIEISDNGMGIPSEKLSQIFNPYFTTKSEGTGLGLSIPQRVVEEHGGSISVESDIGKGTTFRVSLNYG